MTTTFEATTTSRRRKCSSCHCQRVPMSPVAKRISPNKSIGGRRRKIKVPTLLALASMIVMAQSFSLFPGSGPKRQSIKPQTQINGGSWLLQSHSIKSAPTTKSESETADQPLKKTADASQIASTAKGITLTPLQIKYPLTASLFGASDDSNHSSKEDGIPFYQAFRRLEEALETIALASPKELDQILGDSQPRVIRLEQSVSHSVDPLGWLHAQNKRQLYNKDALFYIQSTVETAVFGSAWSWTQPTRSSPEFWNAVSSLPQNSYLYGGERFDSERVRDLDREDWKDFGATWWVLPAVELREEPVELVVEQPGGPVSKQTTLAVHLVVDDEHSTSWQEAASEALRLLRRLDDAVTGSQVPATTLPPIMMRESSYGLEKEIDGQDLYERGVAAALDAFDANNSTSEGLQKVVLARRMDLKFQAELSALDILRKWKYNDIHEGGNMFYLRPKGEEEFFGCTPERLFTIQKNSNVVLSEALAGTRPRGTSQAADEALLRDLFGSLKDRNENEITADFIQSAFNELGQMGFVETKETTPSSFSINFDEEMEEQSSLVAPDASATVKGRNTTKTMSSGFFVRRLRHLQHICRRFSARLSTASGSPESEAMRRVEVVKFLLSNLHPTPAVNGYPAAPAMDFIRENESVGFDRGFYAGPVGYMGQNAADILVAIRSGLLSRAPAERRDDDDFSYDFDVDPLLDFKAKVSVYAGAGLVPGSTVQGEWAETSYKLGVVSSLFPQAPITLQSAPTPNVAWASAFIEELIRNGITQFYVCPGSRSTPLVVAIARAARSNTGVVNAVSVHDERGAGFRALGYGRGTNRPAAIITSSGTAVANLYPAIIEAGMDGVPMLVLTADRPYENRDTGANQAIDQVKAFSSSYVRWFRDILPPHDDVPVSVALADAAHSVAVARNQRGPVHINVQFRENLAPDAGAIRNDDRAGSITDFNGFRFTDVPGFSRWSKSGDRWLKSYAISSSLLSGGNQHAAVSDIARLITESRRGIIVVGNVRQPTDENYLESVVTTSAVIADFAEAIGFPIIAGAQNVHLRFSSSAVIPYAEHVLKHPQVAENIKPDLIIQIGAPLVSTEATSLISRALKDDDSSLHHVLIHPHHGTERADPSFTVSKTIATEISPFLKAVTNRLDDRKSGKLRCGSRLAPLVLLGRQLQNEMPKIINEATDVVTKADQEVTLSEPQVTLAVSMMMSKSTTDQSIFMSNSMPIRDAEFFLYPVGTNDLSKRGVFNVGSNRGASGIDGIISSATGFAEATGAATTLLIGDLSALHDINSLHALTSNTNSAKHPLTTILVNNDGGGIFSFLPIAKHGADVSFEDFFGTPTSSFSYQRGAEAFGLPSRQASRFDFFCKSYVEALRSDESSLLEAKVVNREQNVAVHREITRQTNSFISRYLDEDGITPKEDIAPVKYYKNNESDTKSADGDKKQTLVLIHGWMGDKTEWDEVGEDLAHSLGREWNIISIDLPGHGASQLLSSSDQETVRSMLKMKSQRGRNQMSVDEMAKSLLRSLSRDYGITEISALAGYSLGGRVALAMKRLCSLSSRRDVPGLVIDSTKLVLLSAYPGQLPRADGTRAAETAADDTLRLAKDDSLAREMKATSDRICLLPPESNKAASLWSGFLGKWYGMPMWGDLSTCGSKLDQMMQRRVQSLSYRGRDLADILRYGSPPRNSREDWRGVYPSDTLFLAGSRDRKYAEIGEVWSKQGIKFVEVPDVGHGLLVEASQVVSGEISRFIASKREAVNLRPLTEELLVREQSSIIDTKSTSDVDTIAFDRFEPPKQTGTIGSVDFDPFFIEIVDQNREKKGVQGIGWGDKAKRSNQLSIRSGFILQLVSNDGSKVGVGEISPLPGLHKESLNEAEGQLLALRALFERENAVKEFLVEDLLALEGGLNAYMKRVALEAGLEDLLPSVLSGFEMALLSLASQVVQKPLHQALLDYAPQHSKPLDASPFLPVNGFISRGASTSDLSREKKDRRTFPSLKVKVGHQDITEDTRSVLQALQESKMYRGAAPGMIRADANRAWELDSAVQFANALEDTSMRVLESLEFVEEPLERQEADDWSLASQVDALERWHKQTGMLYALDESLADLAEMCNHEWAAVEDSLTSLFGKDHRGCGAFVLKPALLGVELSIRIARLARKKLNIGVSFSSSFDSGVGLAYTAVLASLADATGKTQRFSHGVGTFSMLDSDTLSPAFASYVNDKGILNIFSLSRALFGLGLDELRDSQVFFDLPGPGENVPIFLTPSALEEEFDSKLSDENEYEASTSTSSSGREITLVVSLPLPFSADTGFSRFADLPQQSRWSPWIRSVRYLDDGRETEWTLNVRGVQFRWRALSAPLEPPLKGIQWESVSGLKNKGIVEFLETGPDNSVMKVRMSIMTPRALAAIFQSTSVFLEDFIRNKLLKWSLEMFRDVVKADLALERGDVELGDALFGSVEGKATAIEAALSPTNIPNNEED